MHPPFVLPSSTRSNKAFNTVPTLISFYFAKSWQFMFGFVGGSSETRAAILTVVGPLIAMNLLIMCLSSAYRFESLVTVQTLEWFLILIGMINPFVFNLASWPCKIFVAKLASVQFFTCTARVNCRHTGRWQCRSWSRSRPSWLYQLGECCLKHLVVISSFWCPSHGLWRGFDI